MKPMKPLLKLLFVGLLVGWVVSQPSPVGAQSGGYYQCNSGAMGQCTGAIFQYMNQCVGSCPHQGSDEQLCYDWPSCGYNCVTSGTVTTCSYDCTDSAVCGDYPSSGANCIQECMYVAENMLEGCYSSDCTWVSN
jgi:hypothetical protein